MSAEHIRFLTAKHSGFRPDLLTERLRVIGLSSSDASLIRNSIAKWIRENGIVWTVEHLKKVKQLYLNYFAGSGVNPPWIARTREGIPQGAFYVLKDYRRSKVVKTVNIYKIFMLVNPVSKQVDKFMSAVTKPWTVPDRAFQVLQLGLPRGFRKLSTKGEVLRIHELPASIPQATYHSWSLGRVQKWNIDEIILDARAMLRQVPATSWLTSCLDPVGYEPDGRSDELKRFFKKNPNVGAVGSLGASQQPGLKLRFFANPHLVYQCLLEPLKRSLKAMLERIPEDCCFDSGKGVLAIQAALRAGKTVSSVDLSNATDRFPLSLQEHWLRQTQVDERYVNLLLKCCKGYFVSSKTLRASGVPERVKWAVGQPLGLGPSFFWFSLTHHFVIRGLCRELGFSAPFPYVVHGDDVVIFEQSLAEAYKAFMLGLGCPYAPDKTITSAKMAEFDGMVITATEALKSTSHKRITQENVIDYGVEHGPSVLHGVHLPRVTEIVPILAQLPECVGGLGWDRHLALDELLKDPQAKKVFDAFTQSKEEPIGVPKEVIGREQLSKVVPVTEWTDQSYGSNQNTRIFESEPMWKVRQDWIARANETETKRSANSHKTRADRNAGPTLWRRIMSLFGFSDPLRRD